MIEKDLYKNLSRKEKLMLMHSIRGSFALVGIPHYQEINNNPEPETQPIQLLLSNILDIDFSEFYNRVGELTDFCKTHKEELLELYEGTTANAWFIGDGIEELVLHYLDADNGYIIGADLLYRITERVQKIYNFYLENSTLTSNSRFKYVEFGELGGEKIYKRVKKYPCGENSEQISE